VGSDYLIPLLSQDNTEKHEQTFHVPKGIYYFQPSGSSVTSIGFQDNSPQKLYEYFACPTPGLHNSLIFDHPKDIRIIYLSHQVSRHVLFSYLFFELKCLKVMRGLKRECASLQGRILPASVGPCQVALVRKFNPPNLSNQIIGRLRCSWSAVNFTSDSLYGRRSLLPDEFNDVIPNGKVT